MMNDRTYTSVLHRHLAGYFSREDLAGLSGYLDSLSHSDFRKAGFILGENILPELPETVFWDVFLLLLRYDARALLGTMMKAAVRRVGRKALSLSHPGYMQVAHYLNEGGFSVDKQKIILRLIPVLDAPEDLLALFRTMQVEEARVRVDYLLRHISLPTAYLLFQEFRRLDHDKAFLSRCCSLLMKRGDALSFNLASVTKSYFDLPAVGGTFSLRLRPYELSLLEASYADFCAVMRRV